MDTWGLEICNPHSAPRTWKRRAIFNKFLSGISFILKVIGLDLQKLVSPATILFAVLAYLWRKYVLTSVSLEKDPELCRNALTWVVERNNRWRHLRAVSPRVHESICDHPQSRKRTEKDPIKYEPHIGTHIFWWGMRPFLLRVESEMGFGGGRDRECVDVITFGSPQCLRDFVEHIKQWSIVQQKGKTSIRCPERYGYGYQWTLAYKKHSRPMETVVLDQAQKSAIIEDMEAFLLDSSRRLYASRGIPYRRGYLLHGPPGTGKSTLCYALAGHFGLDIYVVSLVGSKLGDDHLESLFRSLPESCIVVLEDVDAGVLRRDNEATLDNRETWREHNGISLSGLLNTIDGIASHEGRVLIMTTNRPESLDEALTRPGRVDMKIKFTLATMHQIYGMFYGMYRKIRDVMDSNQEDDLMKHNQGDVEHDDNVKVMAKTFSELVPEGKFSPAEIQGFLIKWKEPKSAIDNARSWVEKLLKKKDTGSGEAVRTRCSGRNGAWMLASPPDSGQ